MKLTKREIGDEINKVQEAIRLLQETIKGKRETLRRLQQGGLSDDVFMLKTVQDYINDFGGNCLGLLGMERSKSYDKRLEENRPGTKSELGSWVTSKSSRYFWSSDQGKNKECLKEKYKSFISDL